VRPRSKGWLTPDTMRLKWAKRQLENLFDRLWKKAGKRAWVLEPRRK
jgi:hypothetical protein